MATKMNTNSVKPFKIIKLDRRYTGHQYFKYAIDYTANRSLERMLLSNSKPSKHAHKIEFTEHRNWFWEMYGPSTDITSWLDLEWMHKFESFEPNYVKPITDDWCWNTEYGHTKIYLKDYNIVSHFVLVHSQLDNSTT